MRSLPAPPLQGCADEGCFDESCADEGCVTGSFESVARAVVATVDTDSSALPEPGALLAERLLVVSCMGPYRPVPRPDRQLHDLLFGQNEHRPELTDSKVIDNQSGTSVGRLVTDPVNHTAITWYVNAGSLRKITGSRDLNFIAR